MLDLKKSDLLAFSILVISAYVILSKLLWPSTLEITYFQGNETVNKTVPSIYTYPEMLLITVAGLLFGSSIALIYHTSKRPDDSSSPGSDLRERNLETLKDKEKLVYGMILKNNGFMFQSELLEKAKMPKSTLSITLDRLEAKGFLKRERRGMGNVIVLK